MQTLAKSLIGVLLGIAVYQLSYSGIGTTFWGHGTWILQVLLGAITGATALILSVVLYVTRADALMGEESPTSLVSRLEERMWDERFCFRALDLLHGAMHCILFCRH